jgi:hypothetical protein
MVAVFISTDFGGVVTFIVDTDSFSVNNVTITDVAAIAAVASLMMFFLYSRCRDYFGTDQK